MATRQRTRLVALGVAVVTLLVFAPSLWAGFVSDDWSLIVHNTHAHGLDNLGRALTTGFWDVSAAPAPDNPVYRGIYRPLVKAAQLLEHEVFGQSPAGYHAVSIALHALVALLLFLWLRRRHAGAPDAATLGAAAVGSLLFALLPARVESVTWISGLPDVAMTACALGGLLSASSPRPSAVLGTGLFFAAAVLSKEAALVMPVLLAVDVVLLRGEARASDALRRKAKHLVAAAAGVLSALVLRFAFVPSVGLGSGDVADLLQRVLASLGHYVLATLWPLSTTVHPAIRMHDESYGAVYDPAALFAGAATVVAVAVLGMRARRAPRLRPWLADLCYFLLPLVPVLNIVPLGHYSWISERFLFLPHLGIAALVTRALLGLAASPDRALTRVLFAGALPALFGLATLTVIAQGHFASDEALWEYEHRENPRNVVAARELASLAADAGLSGEAQALLLGAYDQAVRAHDRRLEIDVALELARLRATSIDDADHAALGALRDFYASIVEGREATLEIGGGVIALRLSDEERQRLAEDSQRVQLPWATAEMRDGALSESVARLREITRREPRDVDAYDALALARARRLHFEAARRASARARAISGGDARSEAIASAIEAAALEMDGAPGGDDIEGALSRSRAQLALGSFEGARQALAPLLQRAPPSPEVVMAAVRVEVAAGHVDRARAILADARRRDPSNEAGWQRALGDLERLAGGGA